MLRTFSRRTAIASLLLMTSVLMSGCGNENNSGGGTGEKKLKIAVIAKSTVNAYWKAVEAGARQAAKEGDVEIVWTGPDAETAHSQQADMLDNQVNGGVSGVVIAPTNFEALVRPIESAVSRGVPVIIIDSPVNTNKPVAVVTTDNYAAGREAADALIKAVGTNKKHGGKVLMLRFLEGSASTEQREKGFIDRVKEAGLDLVESQYTKGGGSTTDASETADALLRRHINNNQLQVDGVFASNQPTAIGMLSKLDEFRAGGTTIEAQYVGFDAHEVLLRGVREGKIAAIVVQDPKNMGYLGVKTMIAHLKGEKIEAKVATATATVTKDNIGDPKIRAVTLQD